MSATRYIRRPTPRRIPPAHQEPLEDRVDTAGIKQCNDPAEAKRSRAQGRVDAAVSEGYEPDEADVVDAAK